MADTKISDFTDGAPAQSTDIVPLARSGTNRRITIANLFSLFISTARSWVSGADTTTIAATGVGASDATDSASLNSTGVTVTDGTEQTTLTKSSLQIADGGGNTLNADVDDVTVSDGTNTGSLTPVFLDMSGAAGSIAVGSQTTIVTEVATGAAWVECRFKISLTAAEILTLNSTPVDIAIPEFSAAAGTIIVPKLVAVKLNVGGTPFDVAASLRIVAKTSTINDYLLTTHDNFIANTSDIIELMRQNRINTYPSLLVSGDALQITSTADSTEGDGTIDLYFECEQISL